MWNGLDTRSPAIAAPAAQTDHGLAGSISVSGTSAIRVRPDRVVILLGVEVFASTPSAAQARDKQASQAVVNAIKNQGVAVGDIATAAIGYPGYTRGTNYMGLPIIDAAASQARVAEIIAGFYAPDTGTTGEPVEDECG